MTQAPSKDSKSMMVNEVLVSLGGRDWKSERARLGKYLDLTEIVKRLIEAISKRDTGGIAGGLFEYLCALIPNLSRELFDSAPWYEITRAYNLLVELNAIPQAERFAILHSPVEERADAAPWDYPGRLKKLYVHIMARAYGWPQNEILELWPEDAIGYIQEILADEQFEREFVHAHSEVSYGYNATTKKTTFQKLERPAWMILGSEIEAERKKKELQQEKIPSGMLPAGVVKKAADR